MEIVGKKKTPQTALKTDPGHPISKLLEFQDEGRVG